MREPTEGQTIKHIDHMIDRWWELMHKKKLTEAETAEAKGWSKKVELFKIGTKIDGLNLQEYLAKTDREWGDHFLKSG